jgi:putative endonuclease
MTDRGRQKAPWFVYIVSCSDGTYYTGITTDIERRLREHNETRAGARYTRARRPVKLVYRESAASRSEAARRESRVRRIPAAEKREMAAASASRKTNLAQRCRGAGKGKTE